MTDQLASLALAHRVSGLSKSLTLDEQNSSELWFCSAVPRVLTNAKVLNVKDAEISMNTRESERFNPRGNVGANVMR